MKTILILVLLTNCALGNELCETDSEKLWICKGDAAWANGYLVPPKTMDSLISDIDLLEELRNRVSNCSELLNKYSELSEIVEETIKDCDATERRLVVIHQDTLKEIEYLSDDYAQLEGHYRDKQRSYEELKSSSIPTGRATLYVVGATVIAFGIGFGVSLLTK